MRNGKWLIALVALMACSPGPGDREMTTFRTAEAARSYVTTTELPKSGFTIRIADDFTFAGHPDTSGAGMAVVLDTILAKGFMPDGFQQGQGFRTYRYKPLR